jgi:hypothetical protein
MAARIFLGASALLWIPYGVYCFFRPEALAEAAGVSFGTPTGSTEIRATYGGLTFALGALAALGALSTAWTRQALVTLGVACAGFGFARVAGVVMDGGATAYTVQALVVEFVSVALVAVLLARTSAPQAA